jgi:two-component system, CitB family, response regulator DctR
VEDDPMVREIHRKFIAALEGFTVAGEAVNGREALDILQKKDVDLVILDIFMPEMDGINTLRVLRNSRRDLDVIVITAAQGGDIIKEASRLGAYDYQVKPFNFERFKHSMESYRKFFTKIKAGDDAFSQAEIDGIFHAREEGSLQQMPKGLQRSTLNKIVSYLQEKRDGISSEDAASVLGVSRVTARRYLEYLVSAGKAVVEPEYRELGRPINKYRIL